MSPKWWSVVRYAGTAVFAGLVAASQYWPANHVIAIAIVVLGVLGYHVVPTAPPMYKVTVDTHDHMPEGTVPVGAATVYPPKEVEPQ